MSEENVRLLSAEINADSPLIGIEPSCILGFRDEFPKMVDVSLKSDAVHLANNAFLIDEFIAHEIKKGHIHKDQFTQEKREVVLHGHCHQKAISSTQFTKDMIGIIEHYSVTEIPSGCCGMAGSFGYEKEHFDISNQIGELVLLPAVRNAKAETIVVAPGTSCRHQILDGTGRKAKHPLELLFEALK